MQTQQPAWVGEGLAWQRKGIQSQQTSQGTESLCKLSHVNKAIGDNS
jgi:hypothetical protein